MVQNWAKMAIFIFLNIVMANNVFHLELGDKDGPPVDPIALPLGKSLVFWYFGLKVYI